MKTTKKFPGPGVFKTKDRKIQIWIKSHIWVFQNEICDPDPTTSGSAFGNAFLSRIEMKCKFGVFQCPKVKICIGLMLNIRISLIPL